MGSLRADSSEHDRLMYVEQSTQFEYHVQHKISNEQPQQHERLDRHEQVPHLIVREVHRVVREVQQAELHLPHLRAELEQADHLRDDQHPHLDPLLHLVHQLD